MVEEFGRKDRGCEENKWVTVGVEDKNYSLKVLYSLRGQLKGEMVHVEGEDKDYMHMDMDKEEDVHEDLHLLVMVVGMVEKKGFEDTHMVDSGIHMDLKTHDYPYTQQQDAKLFKV